MVQYSCKITIFAYQKNQITNMSDIKTIFKKQHGYARMKDLKFAKIHTRDIASACANGIIEKIKPGLYKLIDYPWDEHSSFTDIYAANPNAVICLVSAIEYYGLTTFNPIEVSLAVAHNASKLKIAYPPIKVFFFKDKYYETGIETVKSNSGTFKIYSVEKTLVDLFRYKKKTGDDIVLEALKNYLVQKKHNINKLLECAQFFGMQKKMLPYIKALVI